MKVLVTGFEPNDDGLNASEIVITSLRDHPTQALRQYIHAIEFIILPGNTNQLGQVVRNILNDLSPDLCLGIGQARGYNKIALERMAKNLRYFVTRDKAGNAPKGEPIVSGAAAAYWHSLTELDKTASLLEKHNIPAKVSNDCGTHLCNQSFYHLLHWRKEHHLKMRVGFVHIPALPEQVIQYWPEAPFMPIEMTREALSLILHQQIQAISSSSL
ncbi:MAG: hypothetical protein AAFX78_05770 [Cyanobacteria bacterium J06638_20]